MKGKQSLVRTPVCPSTLSSPTNQSTLPPSHTGRRLVGSLMNGLREVVLECYSLLPQADTAAGSAATNDALLGAAREVRRLCNILFAFVRQDVRESINGFLPGSDLERVPFDPTKVRGEGRGGGKSWASIYRYGVAWPGELLVDCETWWAGFD